MSSHWTFSHYSAAFEGLEGELLLCNSFMGAVARIPSSRVTQVREAISRGVSPTLAEDAFFSDLCRNGFFVPDEATETSRARTTIRQERDHLDYFLIVMPHENCNFRCTYCYETFENGKMLPHVVSGVKRIITSKVAEHPVFRIGWFGGEPLLARDVISEISTHALNECRSRNVTFLSGMTTNGYLLTPDVATELLRLGINQFQITLDGPPATHNKTRALAGGRATYDAVFANVCSLRRRSESMKVRIRVNFLPESIDHITTWLPGLAKELAGDHRFSMQFQPAGRWGGPNDDKYEICDSKTSADALHSLTRAAIREGMPSELEGFFSPHGARCYAGSNASMVVGSNGIIYKCTVAFSDPRNQVGRIDETGNVTIDPRHWRLWTETDEKSVEKCSSCWFYGSCQSRACPLAALENERQEPPCPSNPVQQGRLLRLAVYGARAS